MAVTWPDVDEVRRSGASARDLARKIAIATKSRCSESTAHAIKDLLIMRASLNATLTPLTARDTAAEVEQA